MLLVQLPGMRRASCHIGHTSVQLLWVHGFVLRRYLVGVSRHLHRRPNLSSMRTVCKSVCVCQLVVVAAVQPLVAALLELVSSKPAHALHVQQQGLLPLYNSSGAGLRPLVPPPVWPLNSRHTANVWGFYVSRHVDPCVAHTACRAQALPPPLLHSMIVGSRVHVAESCPCAGHCQQHAHSVVVRLPAFTLRRLPGWPQGGSRMCNVYDGGGQDFSTPQHCVGDPFLMCSCLVAYPSCRTGFKQDQIKNKMNR